MAPADLAESGPPIQPASGYIAFADFQIDRADAGTREPAQVQIEQLPRKTASFPAGCYSDGKDFSFIRGGARENETDQFGADRQALSGDIAIEQQLANLVRWVMASNAVTLRFVTPPVTV